MENYIKDKKKLYSSILEFVENLDENTRIPNNKNDLKKLIFNLKISENHEEIIQFLQLMNSISDHHHRERDFINKIMQVLQYYKDQINHTLSNIELFHIFENNKLILYFLLKHGIITMSNQIYTEIMNKKETNGNRFCHFFYTELVKFAGEEKMKDVKNELLNINPNIFEEYDEKRQKGENDSKICSLIREDSVEEFIMYINRMKYSPSSLISPSIFETNSFLNDQKSISMIEYSSFYGSIQIFQYLILNQVALTPSLWLYSIHSKNPEMIHLLESNKVPPPKYEKWKSNNDFIMCMIESIKCHHNDIAEYIENNLLFQNDSNQRELIVSNCIKYQNYFHFEVDSLCEYGFFYLCSYNYNKLVELLLEKVMPEIVAEVIPIIKYCLIME